MKHVSAPLIAITNGLGDKVGSLTPGKRADLLLLETRALNIAPVNDPVGAVVLGMDLSNVDSVFVDGKPIKWRGRMLDGDLDHLLAEASAAQAAVYQRAGFPLPGV